MRTRILLMFLLMAAMPVWAATYKCEIGGQVVYGDKPCEKGTGRQVTVQDPLGTSSGKPLTSDEQLKREKQKADALRKERLKREQAEEKARQKAARQAQKEAKKRKARCQSLAKSLAQTKGKRKGKQPDPAKREEYERECRDTGGMN